MSERLYITVVLALTLISTASIYLAVHLDHTKSELLHKTHQLQSDVERNRHIILENREAILLNRQEIQDNTVNVKRLVELLEKAGKP